MLHVGPQKRRAAAVKQPTTRQAKKGDVTGPDDSIATRAATAAKSTAATAQDKANEVAGAVCPSPTSSQPSTAAPPVSVTNRTPQGTPCEHAGGRFAQAQLCFMSHSGVCSGKPLGHTYLHRMGRTGTLSRELA